MTRNTLFPSVLCLLAAAVLSVGCSKSTTVPDGGGTLPDGGSALSDGGTSSDGGGTSSDAGLPSGPVSPTAIPLGDGHVSTSPRAGYVDSCTTSFRTGGASHSGAWLDADAGTWNATTKPAVQGSVSWPDASNSFVLMGASRIVTTNDLPEGLTTGVFPISPSDPAYAYDTNPNAITAQSITYTLPAMPTAAASPSCLGLGPIGITTAGVLFFDALDAAGRDAAAHEIQDSCDGHPQMAGIYHYHSISHCIVDGATGSSTLVGYALDGYGLYVERDADGNLLTNADLDECHGRTSPVMWDGTMTNMYHYDVTLEYPYTLGCYHGTPVVTR